MGRMRRWQNKLFGLTGALSATQTETDDDRGEVGVPGLCGAIVSIWHQCVIRGVTAFGAPATHGRFGHQESRGEEGVEEKGIGEKGGGKGGQVVEGSWSFFSFRVPRPETRDRLSSFVAFPRSFQVAGGKRAFLSIPSPKSDPEHPNNPAYKNTTSTKMRKLNPHRVDWPSLARDGSVVTSSQHHRANTRSLHQRDGSSHPSSHPGTSTGLLRVSNNPALKHHCP